MEKLTKLYPNIQYHDIQNLYLNGKISDKQHTTEYTNYVVMDAIQVIIYDVAREDGFIRAVRAEYISYCTGAAGPS